jgi:hypothetical protein
VAGLLAIRAAVQTGFLHRPPFVLLLRLAAMVEGLAVLITPW